MTTPFFADIEASINDDCGFPTAICWSLEDGQIKSVLIIPEDDWLEEDEDYQQHTAVSDLYNHGAPALDVIREINEDLDGKTVYMPGKYFEEALIEKLFSAYNMDPSFEVVPLSEFLNIQPEQTADYLYQAQQNFGLQSPHESETNVVTMLYMARERGLI